MFLLLSINQLLQSLFNSYNTIQYLHSSQVHPYKNSVNKFPLLLINNGIQNIRDNKMLLKIQQLLTICFVKKCGINSTSLWYFTIIKLVLILVLSLLLGFVNLIGFKNMFIKYLSITPCSMVSTEQINQDIQI